MDNNTGGSTTKMLGSSGPLGDITNLSAAELKNKRARERIILQWHNNKNFFYNNKLYLLSATDEGAAFE
uniref:Uncharacterized protein n=1 Tax=Leersia perrieri TaxID=77586 RepID=A0A0D9XGV4_9ORYZ